MGNKLQEIRFKKKKKGGRARNSYEKIEMIMTNKIHTEAVKERPDNMEVDVIMWIVHLGNPLRLDGNLWINDRKGEDGK